MLERLDALAVAADEANRSRHEPSISPSPAGARLEPAPSSSAAPQAALSPYLLATSSTTTAKRPTRYRPYKPLSGERALRIILDVIASVKATQDYAAQDEARLFSIVDTARRTGMPGSTDAADLAEATRLYRHHSRELQAALRGLDVVCRHLSARKLLIGETEAREIAKALAPETVRFGQGLKAAGRLAPVTAAMVELGWRDVLADAVATHRQNPKGAAAAD